MTGEQIAAPSSPRDGEDVSITLGRPKVYLIIAVFVFVKFYSRLPKSNVIHMAYCYALSSDLAIFLLSVCMLSYVCAQLLWMYNMYCNNGEEKITTIMLNGSNSWSGGEVDT